MLIIWRGSGGLVIIAGILVCLVTNIVTSKAFDESNYFQAHLWPKLAALGITGLMCWFLGRYLHSRPPQLVLDETTGEEVELKPRHDFMFIKIEYWGVIYILIAFVVLVMNVS